MTNNLRISVEKFPPAELTGLREELMRSALDSWQAADLISAFLSGRGFGVCNESARRAVSRMESASCSLKSMQEELEKLALVN